MATTEVKSNIPVHLRDLFPGRSEELLELFHGAEENTSLLQSDLHTIRDWLNVAGYEHESLHALLALLILAEEEGSQCIELSEQSLGLRFADLVPAEQAGHWTRRVLADLDNEDFSKLIGSTADDDRPVIRHDWGGKAYLYFQKYLRHELDFAKALRARLLEPQAPVWTRAGDARAAILHQVLVADPLRPGGKTLTLDDDQRRAVELALLRPVVFISGGPGTGKTSIVLTLLRCLVRSGLTPDRIALAAPTGRAAQRLADAIRLGVQTLSLAEGSPDTLLQDVAATTLHHLLEYSPSRDQFGRHAENPLPQDVVIVDEASMIGMVLMGRLFQALAPRASLILLGDKDQLPSVDAGAVLAHLIPDEPVTGATASAVREALVILQTNHRSEPQIRDSAAKINRQHIEIVDELPNLTVPGLTVPGAAPASWAHLAAERGVRLLEQAAQSPAEMRRFLQSWADYAYLASGYKKVLEESTRLADKADDHSDRRECLAELFRLLEQRRLLTLVREGPWGCVDCNRFLATYLRPRLSRPGYGSLFPGATVLITRNDKKTQLYNGDVGLVLRGPSGGLRVVFPRQGAYLSFPVEALPAHELGFALTVHKSQGSEYGQILLVLPPTGGRRLLTKELVYTGITRAKELAIICATRGVLKLAIQRKCTRESGLLRFD